MSKAECPYCEGDGEVMDSRQVSPLSIDPPMTGCPVCDGSGEIDEEEVDEVDMDKSLYEYEQDQYESAMEAKWEAKNDR